MNRHADPDYFRKYRKAHLEKARAAARKYGHSNRGRDRLYQRLYGVTIEWYEQKLKEQGGVCAICEHAPKKRRLAVDHNHKTKTPRGLLCYRCNRFVVGSGDLKKAKKLIEYFTKYEVDS